MRHIKQNLEKFSKHHGFSAQTLRKSLQTCVSAIKQLKTLHFCLETDHKALKQSVQSVFEAIAAEFRGKQQLEAEKREFLVEKQGFF